MKEYMGNRWMNFKHFVTYLRQDDVFKRFKVPSLTVSSRSIVTLDQLEEGMNQMSYPMMKGIVSNFEDGKTFDGRKMYN